MPTSTTIRVQARELRPVAARIISYGSSSKMAGQATLYLLRVARGGHEWYVARRYSEFRVLYQSLKSALSHPHGRRRSRHGCGHCRELGRQFASVQFPSRYPVRSGFASAKEKIESARMVQLNAFVHVLMETTQGLMVDDDDDDDDEDEVQDEQTTCTNQDIESCHRCDALRVIGEFLMVHEHNDDGSPLQKKASTESTPTTPVIDTAKSPTPRRPRLGSSGSVTFRVQELDVIFRPTSPLSTWATVAPATIEVASLASSSPNVLDEHELDELFLADYASPADDAVVHRQADVADGEVYAKPSAVSALRRTESLRISRRL